MPPKKRGGQDSNTPSTSTTQSTKRQRVSLACDGCRIARERCDGGRPTCATCVAQKRTCSYTPASKKRGVQTGYLRTVELSLAWICDNFPEAEEALDQLLRGDDTARLLGKDRSGNQLHKKWTKSRIHKEIGRFLSDGGAIPTDNPSPGDSESESETPGDTRPRRQPEDRSTNVCLPGNWRRLVDIYFTYTHCWFPIISRESILNTAQAFPAGGIPLQSMVDFPSAYAELWAVLALASFQGTPSQSTPVEPVMSPQRIYSIARNMMPSEERRFELPHLRALLLHSIVLIGQGAGLAAWMLVGTAVRLALHLRETGELYAGDGSANEPIVSPGALAFTACLVLNTFTSACLGQPTFLKVDISDIHAFVDALGRLSEDEEWHTVPGIGPSVNDATDITIQPLKTFHQLYRFTQILSISLDAEARREKDVEEEVTTEDLVKCLEPQFAFCSSVLYGGSTPLVPSAFLLQTAFLAITIHLVTGYRASLLSSLVEVIESCVSQFGTCGTPPIVVGMLGMVHRCGHIEKMHDGERQRWTATIESLRSVWRRPALGASPTASTMDSFASSIPLGHHQASSSMDVTSPNFMGIGFDGSNAFMTVPTPGSGFVLPGNDGISMPQRPSEPFQTFPTNLPTRNLPANSPPLRNTSSGPSRMPWPSSSALMAGSTSSASQGHAAATPLPVDYDAILEELGSIDCTDGLDMDPQFMTNLGFAPGADLGEMFQADFGA